MENLHPNQTTIYDFLPKENKSNCKHLLQDVFDFCLCVENDNYSLVIDIKDCKNCKHFSNQK